jgi:iron complex outermembrane recepter protein
MQMKTLLARASIVALAAAASGLASTAWADTANDAVQTTSSTTVNGVTVMPEAQPLMTAPIAPPLTSPYSVGTVTSDTLRNTPLSPTVTIQTLLNGQLSINATTNGPLGVGTNITFRGFDAGQFAETYDGVQINDIFNGGVTNEADNVNNALLQVSNIDSIDIYRGINNPSVNSYNSLGGTIDFIPRQPSATAGALVGASYGSFDSSEVHAQINSGDVFGVRNLLAVSYAYSDGWDRGFDPDTNLNIFYSGQYTAPNGDELRGFVVVNQNIGHTIFDVPVQLLQQHGGFFQFPQSFENENDSSTDVLGVFDYSANLGSKVTFDSKFFGGGNSYTRTSFANPADRMSSAQPFEQSSQSESTNFWSGSSKNCTTIGSDDCDMFPAGPTYLQGVTSAAAVEAGTQFHLYVYDDWAFGYQPKLTLDLPYDLVTIGGNVTYGELNSKEYFFGTAQVPQIDGFNDAWDEWDERLLGSVYVQDNIHLLDDKLSITPGVKFIYAYTSDSDVIGIFYPFGGSPHNETTFVSPTIGVNYKVTDQFAVFAAFGRNLKLPDISAYYGSLAGNFVPGVTTAANSVPAVTIQPEYVNDYEIGARYQQGGFSGSLNFYLEDFTNTFVDLFDDTTDQTLVANGGSSKYEGIEFQLIDDLGERPWGDLRLNFNFAYNEAEFTSNFETDAAGLGLSDADVEVKSGTPVPEVPNYLVAGDILWTWHNWRVDVNADYVGSQFVNNEVTFAASTTTLPSYTIVNAQIAKTLDIDQPWLKTLKFSLNANNIGNTYYFTGGEVEKIKGVAAGGLYAIPGAPQSFLGTIEAAF